MMISAVFILMPENINEHILQLPPYNAPRGTIRITNAQKADDGFALFDIIEQDGRFLAMLTLTVET